MKASTSELNCENDYFRVHCYGPLAVFRFKGNFLLNLTILKAKESILSSFSRFATHPELKIVIILSNPRKARREEFLSFFDMIKSSRLSKNAILRLYRTIDEVILHIIESNLFFINANCGEILPMNTNIALACDYRIIGENTVFQNPALELGLVSKGGGVWFLKNSLSKGRLYDLLLSTQQITAKEAIAMGLADICVPAAQLESKAFEIGQQFAKQPISSIKLAKRLINHSMIRLSDYLEYENCQLMEVMHERRIFK
ncbi:enoyl-CoA hydratase/isomerase family protein [Desulfosarcina ovata]|uniref:Enoyl-CoA hydratase n=1 Tax=Desulfosarcina ovata subsp. ovata TaxID=2752305 RepID=A0A5K8AIM2_9BACT|nr:enoyl-CoA hydratase/isomerase family protein [Desulfosarcina ovata]BBO92336.1 hypothetical protein DSCOOX_55160 [Desulfosarcina ovata subsp. ovata]